MDAGGDIRSLFFAALHSPWIKPALTRVPLVRRAYGGATWTHPFDREYGTDTSGLVAREALHGDAESSKNAMFYAGSQPGILRRVFATLPDKPEYTLVDLGCGKGRPLFVASEFPFKSIVGVDMSPDMLDVARSNADVVRRNFPHRRPITLVLGNASRFVPEAPRVVFFLYHPFGRDGVLEFLEGLEAKVERGAHVFVVYYNPVWAAVLDGSPRLRRWSAQTLPYDRSEIGYGMDIDDTVVVWQSLPTMYPSHDGAQRSVVLTSPTRAELRA
jgi:SAM-dependent methyltransferase